MSLLMGLIFSNDRSQLANISLQAKEELKVDKLTVVADRGYYNGEEIKSCSEANIEVYLPKCETSGNQAKGLFGKRDFTYKPEDDEYECPAGDRAIYRHNTLDRGKSIRRYWSSACVNCKMTEERIRCKLCGLYTSHFKVDYLPIITYHCGSYINRWSVY